MSLLKNVKENQGTFNFIRYGQPCASPVRYQRGRRKNDQADCKRYIAASDYFLVAVDRKTGKIAGFLNGIAVNESAFRDEFFTDASLHDPNGKVIMLLGLDVLPTSRKQGLARELVFQYQRRAQSEGKKMLSLTCLPNKVKMYKKFGFADRGISASKWGGEAWHEMTSVVNI